MIHKVRSSFGRFQTRTLDAGVALRGPVCLLTVLVSVLAIGHPAVAMGGDYERGKMVDKPYTGVPQSQGPVRQDSDRNRPPVPTAADVRSNEKSPPRLVPGGKASPFSVPNLDCKIQNDKEKKEALLMVRHISAAPLPAGFVIEWKCTRVHEGVSNGKPYKQTDPQQGAYPLSGPLPPGRWIVIKKFHDVGTVKGWAPGISSTYYSDCRSSAKPSGERLGPSAPERAK
jgi:hypothetical protein